MASQVAVLMNQTDDLRLPGFRPLITERKEDKLSDKLDGRMCNEQTHNFDYNAKYPKVNVCRMIHGSYDWLTDGPTN